MKRMFVQQYACLPGTRNPLSNASADDVASLDTHDTPTFAAFWRGLDVDERRDLGLLDDAGAREQDSRRAKLRGAILGQLRRDKRLTAGKATTGSVLRGCLSHLADGDADLVMVNLEDLWLETRPQNVPGTTNERPNWRRRTRYPLETIRRMPRVLQVLRAVNRRRGKKRQAEE